MQLLDTVDGIHKRATKAFEAVAPVTWQRARVLEAIAENAGKSQTVLVGVTGVDRSTLAQVTSGLVKDGLVARKRRRDDRRAYEVTLTPSGTEKLRECRKAYKRVETEIAAIIGKGE